MACTLQIVGSWKFKVITLIILPQVLSWVEQEPPPPNGGVPRMRHMSFNHIRCIGINQQSRETTCTLWTVAVRESHRTQSCVSNIQSTYIIHATYKGSQLYYSTPTSIYLYL